MNWVLNVVKKKLQKINISQNCAFGESDLTQRDGQTHSAAYRICRKAGLPEHGWHIYRPSFATHAAQFGVNPWRLQSWLGHKSINESEMLE
jgi:integrase